MSREIVEVYADWQPIEAPLLIGLLSYSDSSRGGVFSFAYDKAFLTSAYRLQIDPILPSTPVNSKTMKSIKTSAHFLIHRLIDGGVF